MTIAEIVKKVVSAKLADIMAKCGALMTPGQQGDMYYLDENGALKKFPKGTSGQILMSDGIRPGWVSPKAAIDYIPVISDISATVDATGAAVNFIANPGGTYYYLVYAHASPAPDAATIKLQGDAIAKGTAQALAGVQITTINIVGLTAATEYDVYLIVEDATPTASLVTSIHLVTKAAA